MTSKNYLFYGICLLPIATFLFILSINVINLPFYDDYDTVLRYLKQFHFDDWESSENLFSKLILPHNEHRILLSRITVLIYHYFFDIINIKHLVLFQNIFLFLTFLFVLKVIKETKLNHKQQVITLAVFSLFNLAFWSTSFFFSGGIQHYTSFLFSFLCLYLINKAPQITNLQWIGALLCGFVATFSFGCGLLVMPIGAFLLWVKNQKRQSVIWGAVTCLFALIYITNAGHKSSDPVAFNLFSFIKFFFTFLGSPFYINAYTPTAVWINTLICMIIGSMVFLFWIYLFFSGYYKKNTLLYCLFSFCVATGLLLAYSRFDYNASGGVVSRYMFFSRCLFIWLVIIFMNRFEIRKRYLKFFTFGYLAVWAMMTINTIPQINSSKVMLADLILGWKKGEVIYLVPQYSTTSFSEILSWSIEHNIYQLPTEEEIKEFKTISY